jgi:hypothetical protein
MKAERREEMRIGRKQPLRGFPVNSQEMRTIVEKLRSCENYRENLKVR